LIQNGYVVLKIEDLKKYGLWEEEEWKSFFVF
jgi:hypothetical protein